MGSPYAQKSSSGGSVYAQSGKTGGSTYTGKQASTPPPSSPHHRGFFGSIVHDVGSGLGAAGHVAAKTTEGLANDLYNLPGGLYTLGKHAGEDVGAYTLNSLAGIGRATGQQYTPAPRKTGRITSDVKLMGKQAIISFEHPLRAPDQTLLNGLSVASLGAGAALRLAAAGDALRAGDFAAGVKALGRTPKMPDRVVYVGDARYHLHASRAPLTRAVQALHDRIVQGAYKTNPEGRLGQYWEWRLRNAGAETDRFVHAVRDARTQLIRNKGRHLDRAEQAAIQLVSEQTTPAERIRFHEQQIQKGVEPGNHRAQINLMRQVEKRGLVKEQAGHLIIDPKVSPRAAAADYLVASGGALRDEILRDTGEMTAAGQQIRKNAPAHVVATGEKISEANPVVAGAREGRTYINARAYQGNPPRGPVARANTRTVGGVRNIVSKAPYKGENRLAGVEPANVTEVQARSLHTALRKLNTLEQRRQLVKAGSPVKRRASEMLVNTQELRNAKLPERFKGKVYTPEEEVQHLGGLEALRQKLFEHPEHGTGGDLPVGTGAPKGWTWVPSGLVGRELTQPLDVSARFGKFSKLADRVNAATTFFTVYLKPSHVITRGGTNAMLNLLQGSLLHPGTLKESFRVWSGLSPLDKERFAKAVGVHGAEAPLQALPGELREPLSLRAARRGASVWARNADRPFRVNGLIHELRRRGIKTTGQVTQFLDDVEHMHDLPDARFAEVNQILKDANRWNIAYDRLSPLEKRTLARYFWFYPWTAASVRYAGHLAKERPTLAAGLVNTSNVGAAQRAPFQPLPSYMGGSFPIGGDKFLNLNTVSPLSTPAEVLSSVGHAGHPTDSESFSNYLSPVASALITALTGQGVPRHGNRLVTAGKDLISPTPEYSITNMLEGGDQSRKTYPVRNRAEELLLELLLGSARPRTVNLPNAHAAAAKGR